MLNQILYRKCKKIRSYPENCLENYLENFGIKEKLGVLRGVPARRGSGKPRSGLERGEGPLLTS